MCNQICFVAFQGKVMAQGIGWSLGPNCTAADHPETEVPGAVGVPLNKWHD